MSATVILEGCPAPGQLPLPQDPTLHYLHEQTLQGHLLIPQVSLDEPLGYPPAATTHFSRTGEYLQEGDRPPLQAWNNGLRALFLATVNYPALSRGYANHSGIRPYRDNVGKIIGFDCFISDDLKKHLQDWDVTSTVICIESEGFTPQEPEGQGNAYYAAEGTSLHEVGRCAVHFSMLGNALLESATDPITDPEIREYYTRIGTRGLGELPLTE